MPSGQTCRLIDQDHTVSWITRKEARKLLRDGIVRVIRQRPFTLAEKPRVRAMFSSRYLEDRHSPALRVYRDDLYKTLVESRTGKPARAHGHTPSLDEGHVPMPHGVGRE